MINGLYTFGHIIYLQYAFILSIVVCVCVCVCQSLTGETPFQSPSSFSVLTTVRKTFTMPTLPELKQRKEINHGLSYITKPHHHNHRDCIRPLTQPTI